MRFGELEAVKYCCQQNVWMVMTERGGVAHRLRPQLVTGDLQPCCQTIISLFFLSKPTPFVLLLR